MSMSEERTNKLKNEIIILEEIIHTFPMSLVQKYKMKKEEFCHAFEINQEKLPETEGEDLNYGIKLLAEEIIKEYEVVKDEE